MEGTAAEPLAKVIVPPLVRLMVLPGVTVVATPAVSGVIVKPEVMVPTVPVPETVIWLLPVALGGRVMAELAASVTEEVPLALVATGVVVVIFARLVLFDGSVPAIPGSKPPTAIPSGTVLVIPNESLRAAF